MINFVVVEDNKQFRKLVVKDILSYMMNNKFEFKIHEFNDCNDELFKYIKNNYGNNIYILDFDLPSGCAIDISREIRQYDWISQLIILTAYDSFAFSSFKKRLSLLDFISKDDNYKSNLYELFDLCTEIFGLNKCYKFSYKNIIHTIPMRNILYVIREGRRSCIVTDNELYYQNISVNEIKKFLCNSFVKSTKGVIINMDRVKSLNWKTFDVIFDNDLCKNLLSSAHKKEIENYGND